MHDTSYVPPMVPKSEEARKRIYAGIAKNELLAQCAAPPGALGLARGGARGRQHGGLLASARTPAGKARSCTDCASRARRRSLSDAQKEVIVNGVIEVPTQGGDAVINQVRSAPLSRETLRRSPWSRVGGRRWTRVDPTLSCAGGPCAALSGSAVAHSQPPRDRASTATTST